MGQIIPEIRCLRNKMFEKGLHWCSSCRDFLPSDQFCRNTRAYYGYNYKCKNCIEANRPEIKYNDADYRRMHRYQRKKKALLIKLGGGCCQRCGYKEFLSGLSFHHIDPHKKETANFHRIGIAKAKEEIDKCILLCMCCHIAYHAHEWSAQFVKRDGTGWTIEQYVLPSVKFRED